MNMILAVEVIIKGSAVVTQEPCGSEESHYRVFFFSEGLKVSNTTFLLMDIQHNFCDHVTHIEKKMPKMDNTNQPRCKIEQTSTQF